MNSKIEIKIEDNKIIASNDKNEDIGVLDFYVEESVMTITHINVDSDYEGCGIAGNMMLFAMKYIETNGYKFIPICPYAASWINKHEEYKDLEMKEIEE